MLTASATNIGAEAPIFYRGVRVGRVERKALSADGSRVDLFVLIRQSYAVLVRENTKFWDVSGLRASLGFVFLRVETESLQSIVSGGIAFATPDNANMGPAVKPGHRFELNQAPRREWLRWTPSLSADQRIRVELVPPEGASESPVKTPWPRALARALAKLTP